MARSKERPAPVKLIEYASLKDTYGLDKGEEIRWQYTHGGSWYTGTAVGVNKDGSLRAVLDGGFKAFWPGSQEDELHPAVERKGIGPRGGTVWLSLEVPDASNAAR